MKNNKTNNKTRRSQRVGKSAKGRGNGRRKALPNIPFPMLATPDLGHTFQFQASAAVAEQPVTRQDLLNLMVVATTAANAFGIIGAVKIKKVRIWSPILSTFVPETVQIEWNGGLYAPSAIHSAVSEGLFPAKLETSPPPMSSPDLWSLVGATNLAEVLFTVTAPVNSIIQLSAAIRLMDDEPPGVVTAGVALTVGKVYYGFLDGASATGNLVPSGGVAALP
jgi:hypothetical protein